MNLGNILEKLKCNKKNGLVYYQKKEKITKLFPEVYNDILKVVDFLGKMGLKAGEKVGILGNNSYEWVLLDLACIVQGYQSVVFHTNGFESEFLNLFDHYGLKVLFIDADFEKKFNEKNNVFPMTFIAEQLNSTCIEQDRLCECKDEDRFTIVFTSGTTGLPKPIELKAEIVEDFIVNLQAMFEVSENDNITVFLPLSNILQRLYIYAAVLSGFNIVMTKPENIVRVLNNDKPTILVGIPYFFESMYNIFFEKIKSSRVSHTLFKTYSNLYHFLPKKINEQLQRKLFKEITDFWGGKMRIMVTGGASISQRVLEFYDIVGLHLYQVYGMNETGPISMNFPGENKIGSVGKPFPNKTVKVDDNGQILVNNKIKWASEYFGIGQEENLLVFKKDGFIATGDIGYFDNEGFLHISGRVKEMIVLSNAKKVFPGIIESEFNNSKLIKQSAVFGDGKSYLVAVIVTDNKDISNEQLSREIKNINKKIPQHAQVNGFTVVRDAFNLDNKMLTPSMKLNRSLIYKTYKKQIDELY